VPGSNRVTVVDAWTPGGGGKLRDLFKWPPVLILVGRLFLWLLCHWLLTGQIVLYSVMWSLSGAWQMGIVALCALWVIMGGFWYLKAGRGVPPAELWRTGKQLWNLRRIRAMWHIACAHAGITSRLDGRAPRMQQVRLIPSGIEALVPCGKVGRTADEVVSGAKTIAATIGANHVSVSELSPGLARLVLNWGDPTSREITLADIPTPIDGLISFALDPDSRPVGIDFNRSLLLVGETGSGKSNVIWSLLAGLNEAGIPYRLRIIDPAGGVELALLEGRPRVKVYCDRGNLAEAIINGAHEAMGARLSWMRANGIIDLTEEDPDEQNPLDITIIDELLLLGETIKKGVLSPFGELLSVGRKARYVIWACSQLSQVDTLGRIRDLFSQRMCLATKSREMTEAALGPSAEAMGAKCSKITTPGVGYQYVDGQRGYTRFRSVHIPKTGTERLQIAQGKAPGVIHAEAAAVVQQQKDLFAKRTALYRLYAKESGKLLYVGITTNPNTRFKEHAADKPWWTDVDQPNTKIAWYRNRRQAMVAEEKAIKSEDPVFNVVHAKLEETA
jgi:predicted GIY-YIG superfamily endonuclease